MKVRVTFRDEHDILTCMFSEVYDSVDAAKTAIEEDAKSFLDCHSRVDKIDKKLGRVTRRSAKWIDPVNLDYYKATGHDGTTCYWQYFIEK